MSNNYYDILGISKGANDKEIKKAYKKMAVKWHPDKHQEPKKKEEAEKKFKEISNAYTVLGDENKRREYDMFGTVQGEGDDMNIRSDIMEQLFKNLFSGMGGMGGSGGIFMNFPGNINFTQETDQFGGSMNGFSKSVSSQTIIENGKRVTLEKVTITYSDGRTEVIHNKIYH